jgi:hypothetical protein
MAEARHPPKWDPTTLSRAAKFDPRFAVMISARGDKLLIISDWLEELALYGNQNVVQRHNNKVRAGGADATELAAGDCKNDSYRQLLPSLYPILSDGS